MRGPWYTGNTLPWHGRVRGSIPLGSTVMNKNHKIIILTKENYLACIRNSVGSKMFRNSYALVGRKKEDLLRDGDLACAYFVSCVLKIFDLIDKTHLTVSGTLKDMEKSGWFKIKDPKQGSVLVWEKQKFGQEEHSHIGFYIGNKKSISNSSVKQNVKRIPVEHSFTFGEKRNIQAVYWHKKLN